MTKEWSPQASLIDENGNAGEYYGLIRSKSLEYLTNLGLLTSVLSLHLRVLVYINRFCT